MGLGCECLDGSLDSLDCFLESVVGKSIGKTNITGRAESGARNRSNLRLIKEIAAELNVVFQAG